MTATLSSRHKVLYSKQKSIPGKMAWLLILSFIKHISQLIRLIKCILGKGGGRNRQTIPRNKTKIIISMTTFSETVMFEIKCNLYLNHFYAEQICFRAMVTINTQWSNPSTRSSTKSRHLIFFQSILFRSCIVHFDCARGHSDLHLCVCLSDCS